MSQPLFELLHHCTVKIGVPDGSWGTGFFVAPGWVMTCAHVVKEYAAETIQVTVNGQITHDVQDIYYPAQPEIDGVLLKVARVGAVEESNQPCVMLDDGQAIGDAFYIYGFPTDFPEGASADGATSEGEAKRKQETPQGEKLVRLIKFRATQIQGGHSGAALLNRKTGKVCGVVNFTRGDYGNLGGTAVPGSEIWQQFPKVRERNRAFHQEDRRWAEALEQGEPEPDTRPLHYGWDCFGSSTFVGRREELEALHQKLTQSGKVAIAATAGMGGVGKTALAQEYVRQQVDQNTYPGGVWWLSVRELGIVSAVQDAAIVHRWDLPDIDAKTPNADQVRVEWCWRQWCDRAPGQRLLVLDDVQSYRDIRDFLPKDGSFQVLLTSRKRFGPPVDRLDLDVMKRSEAFRTLRRYVDDDERIRVDVATAKQILAWLGYLPLGIELVGRYLNTRSGVSLAMVWQRLQAKRLAAKAVRDVPEEQRYEYNIRAAIDLSWQELSPLAQRVATLMGIFALAPIDKAWIEAALAYMDDDIDEEELEDALDVELVKGSVVGSLQSGVYQLHQLVREFLRDAEVNPLLKAQGRELQRSVAHTLTEQAKTVPQDVTLAVLSQMQPVVPHLTVVAEALTHLLSDDDARWPFESLARLARGQSRWAEAEHWHQQSLEMSQCRFGESHLDVAGSMHNIAWLYIEQGRYEEAEDYALKTLAMEHELLGERHPSVANSLNTIAWLYKDQGRYKKAELYFLQSLDMRRELLGESHTDMAQSLNNLATLYQLQGRYEEAEPYLLKALDMRRELLGESHPEVAKSLNNLATLYQFQGRYEEAKSYYWQSLEIQRELLGENHPEVAKSLNNLATLYQSQGRYEEAEPYFLQALEMMRELLGESHPNVAANLNNLADLYRLQGRYEEAESYYRQALEMMRELLGENHPDVAKSLNNLALLYYLQERYAKAEPYFLQSLEMRRELLGERHPDVAISLTNLSALYQVQGRYEEAEPYSLQSLEMTRELLGESHPNVAISLNNLAGLYELQGRYEEAESSFLQSLEMTRELLGKSHPNVASSLNNLAALYESQRRYEEAESYYRQSLEMRLELLGERHPDISISLTNLASLKYKQGQLQEAERLLLCARTMCKTTVGLEHPQVKVIQRGLDKVQRKLALIKLISGPMRLAKYLRNNILGR